MVDHTLHDRRDHEPTPGELLPDGAGPASHEAGVADYQVAAAGNEADPAADVTAGPVADEAAADLWTDETVRGFQDRWHELQLRFVDDPRTAADRAGALVAETVDAFSTAVASRQAELDGWRTSAGDDDTEQLRMVFRQYRNLLDRLLTA